MFTGLIEEVGTIQGIRRGQRSCVLTIGCRDVLQGSKVGDSIAVNGVCLTVTAMGSGYYTADVMSETMNRSSLGQLTQGARVNLERAMPADGRFGGHIVAGHIDDIGTITSMERDDNAVWVTLRTTAAVLRYIVEKGSITIDGISLTVARVDDKSFAVSVIPHTGAETTLLEKKPGDTVNLETDMVGKYVEKLLKSEPEEEKAQSGITMDFLRSHGF